MSEEARDLSEAPADTCDVANDAPRRGILDDGKRREICAILAVGCTRAIAARYVGCHPDTIRRTAQRDEVFGLAIERAETKHEIKHLSNINKAAQEGRYWRAAAWRWSGKYPARYAQRDPALFTAEQVSQVLGQFADAILEEVPGEEDRQRIVSRLTSLTEALAGDGNEGDEL